MDRTEGQQRRAVGVAIFIAAAVVLFVVFGVPRIGHAGPYRTAGAGIMIAQGNVAGPGAPSGAPGPPSMGAPGAGAMPGAPAAGAAAAVPVVEKGPPIEAWRPDPFSPVEPVALEAKYAGFAGPRWESLPITLRTAFPRPRAPSG